MGRASKALITSVRSAELGRMDVRINHRYANGSWPESGVSVGVYRRGFDGLAGTSGSVLLETPAAVAELREQLRGWLTGERGDLPSRAENRDDMLTFTPGTDETLEARHTHRYRPDFTATLTRASVAALVDGLDTWLAVVGATTLPPRPDVEPDPEPDPAPRPEPVPVTPCRSVEGVPTTGFGGDCPTGEHPRACVCCGVTVTHVPTGQREWAWVGPDGATHGHLVKPPLDPQIVADFRDLAARGKIAAADADNYVATHYGHGADWPGRSHFHWSSGCPVGAHPVRPVPECHGSPMYLSPSGWECRVSVPLR